MSHLNSRRDERERSGAHARSHRLLAAALCTFGCAASIDSIPDRDPMPSPPSARPVGKLFQVILNVHDMPAQVRFYRDVMGFEVLLPRGPADYSTEDFVRFGTGGAHLVLHSGRTSDNVGDEARLSFLTEDVAAARNWLLEAGVWVDEIRSPAPGVLVADARDPEGNAFHIEAHSGRP